MMFFPSIKIFPPSATINLLIILSVVVFSVNDPNGGGLTFAITAGNTGGAFAINGAGQIAVNNNAALDFETTTEFLLTVRVSDGVLSDDAAITVRINDLNEPPSASDATVWLDENAASGFADFPEIHP